MMEFQSKNPVLTRVDSDVRSGDAAYVTGRTATFSGIAVKSGILLSIIFAISLIIYVNLETLINYLGGLLVAGMIVGFISVLIASFSKTAAPFFTIIYAICEGMVLGTISALLNTVLPGIVMDAVIITFAIFGFLLVAYATGIFKVGFTFRKIFYTALISIMFFYLFSFILSLFGLNLIIANPGLILVISLGMVILASFSLLIDFDDCKMAVDRGVPSSFEWQLSLGLLVSLVWLYMEVLRLLIIISRYFKD